MATNRHNQTARGVRAALAWADLDDQHVAAHFGISTRAVSRWRNGDTPPTIETAAELARLCGVPFWLVCGQPPTTIRPDFQTNAGERE